MDEDVEVIGAKWRWSVFLMHGVVLAANVTHDTSQFLANVAQELASNYNYQSSRDEFREQAALEIERLTEGETD